MSILRRRGEPDPQIAEDTLEERLRESAAKSAAFTALWEYQKQAVPEPPPTPDLVTPVTGYRAWTFSMNDGQLYPVNQRSWNPGIWTPGENVARCVKEPWANIYQSRIGSPQAEPQHDAPGRRCQCGFYATSEWGSIQGAPHEFIGQLIYVAGTIEGYGRTLMHQTGWRSEKARVASLVDPCAVAPWVEQTSQYHRILDHLSMTYDVPILDHIPEVNAEVPA